MRSRSVLEDWFTGLSDEKHQVFAAAVRTLESAYGMLSVSLDEAFALRDKAELVRAREQVAISADLLDLLANQLLDALAALAEQGRESSTVPEVTPLKREFFRGETARAIAMWQCVRQRLQPIRRLRYSQKLGALDRAVESLASEFRQAAEEIAEGATIHPGTRWGALDSLHYDLNTCLRETIVILKSFLLGLPVGQFEAFQRRLQTPGYLLSRRLRPRFSRVST